MKTNFRLLSIIISLTTVMTHASVTDSAKYFVKTHTAHVIQSLKQKPIPQTIVAYDITKYIYGFIGGGFMGVAALAYVEHLNRLRTQHLQNNNPPPNHETKKGMALALYGLGLGTACYSAWRLLPFFSDYVMHGIPGYTNKYKSLKIVVTANS